MRNEFAILIGVAIGGLLTYGTMRHDDVVETKKESSPIVLVENVLLKTKTNSSDGVQLLFYKNTLSNKNLDSISDSFKALGREHDAMYFWTNAHSLHEKYDCRITFGEPFIDTVSIETYGFK